jgi:CO/xanthine dehydrogenase FAD-binding subunit
VDIDTVTEFTSAPGATWRAGDAWLGGGTWLFSQPQPELRRLLDLNGFGWPSLVERPEGLEIAATCTIAELSRWHPAPPAPEGQRPEAQYLPAPSEAPRSQARWPAAALLPQCCNALLASFKVWNTATVGGNICLSLPAGPMTSLAASLDGVATLWSPDGSARDVPVMDFVIGAGGNVLRPGEMLRSVTLAASSMRCRTAFRQASLSPVGRSAAVVIARRPVGEPPRDPGVVVTVTAATPAPVQLRFDSVPSPEEATTALDRAGLTYHDDVHGSPAWRAALTRRYVAEVVAELSG